MTTNLGVSQAPLETEPVPSAPPATDADMERMLEEAAQALTPNSPPPSETPQGEGAAAAASTPPGAETQPPSAETAPQPNPEADRLRAELEAEQRARQQLQFQSEDKQLQQDVAELEANDAAAISDHIRSEVARMRALNYEDDAIRQILTPVKQSMEASALYRRNAVIAQEMAFMVGRRYSLSVEQVQQLAASRTGQEFQKALGDFVNAAPSPREQQLQLEMQKKDAQLAAMQAERDAARSGQVPPGQTFGGLAGTGQPPRGAIGDLVTRSLEEGRQLTEQEGDAFDKWINSDDPIEW